MDDLVSRLLEAIDQRAAKATAALDMAVVLNWPRLNGKATMRAYLHEVSPSSTLRRCAADRKIVERCQHIKKWHVSDDFTADSLADEALEDLASAYGLSDHQEGEA